MKTRLLTAALIGASALTATPASAQRIDNVVSFGDSYADTGNAVAIILANPLVSDATKAQVRQLYSTGRFSGGTNYIDTLAQILSASVENYAVGGALTGTGNVNAGLPGFTQETGIFLSGTVPPGTFFPVSDGGFEEGDLLAVSIGGNDARAYASDPAASVALAPAAAAVSVANATANLNALVAAGAPTISFLAGDTSRLPEVAALPPGVAPIRAAFSSAFNAGMQQTLAGYAADGVMVHYLDLNRVLDNVAADPTAFGLTSAGPCPLASATQCVTDWTFTNQYLFYVDGLHLTSRGFAIVAQYVAAQLRAPLTMQALSEVGIDTARGFGRTLSSRLDLSAPRDGDSADGLHFFLVGDMLSHTVEATDASDRFSVDTVGATGGVSYGFGNGVIGVAANWSKPEADFNNNAADVETKSVQLGGFAGFAMGPAFAQAYAGWGWDNHDLSRRGVISDLTADVDGRHVTAGAKAGYLANLGGLRLGPVVALDYARAKVDGYTEEGDSALTLNVDSVRYKSLRGSIGAEVRGDFDSNGVQVRPYAAALVEKDLSGDGRVYRFSQTASPVIVNSWDVGDASKKAYGRIMGGGSARIFDAVTLDAALGTTLGRDDGNETTANVGLNFRF